VHVDDEVREEYWSTIRDLPDMADELTFRSAGKYSKRRPHVVLGRGRSPKK
jgi:hypothetical protein